MSNVKSSIDGNDDAPAGRAPAEEAHASPAPAPKAKKKGRWRRRMLWTLLVLVVGTFALRAVLTLVLPTLVSAAMAPFGLNCSYERSQLNLLSGDAELWHVVLTPFGTRAFATPVPQVWAL